MNPPQNFALALLHVLVIMLLCFDVYSVRPQTVGGGQKLELRPLPGGRDRKEVKMPGLLPNSDAITAPLKNGGIREEIPIRYRARFARWKAELLTTRFGKNQWERFANNSNFILKIVVAEERKRGGRTGKYVWDSDGKLVGATITLGPKIDEGYPNPIYYPVLNALSSNGYYMINGNILAASKISHELGHVDQAVSAEMNSLQKREQLIPVYTSILRENGWRFESKELIDIAREMGGTPVQIYEDREYRSEAYAMRYLGERLINEAFYCHVFGKIQLNVNAYAGEYEKYFDFNAVFPSRVCSSN